MDLGKARESLLFAWQERYAVRATWISVVRIGQGCIEEQIILSLHAPSSAARMRNLNGVVVHGAG